MEMMRVYKVAGHTFGVIGENLCNAVGRIVGFGPFETAGTEERLFDFVEGDQAPVMKEVLYTLEYEDVTGEFGRTEKGFLLLLKPEGREPFCMWNNKGEKSVNLRGPWEVYLYRFAIWVGFGMMVLPAGTVAIHSSCIVYNGKGVLFLGESGTGKSTHTRLWRENIDGAVLLNDDSPFIREEEGKIWAYGSPWSGKTPCYKAERYELAGCVRLSQAPYNKIKKLSILEAYGAIHPSCPPEFAYDGELYDYVGEFINKLLSVVPFYHLACLPDAGAAELSCSTVFGVQL